MKEAFDRIINSIVKEVKNDMIKALTSHVLMTNIKLTYQHAGGKPKDCKDGPFQTYINTIMTGFLNCFVGLQFNAQMLVPITHLVEPIPAM